MPAMIADRNHGYGIRRSELGQEGLKRWNSLAK